MKYLALAALLCGLLSLSNADCYVKFIAPGTTHCMDDVDNTWHAVGSRWRNSRCYDCDCGGCCSAYSTPVQLPNDCVSVFDQEACKYIVHKRDDPTAPCHSYAAVGK